MGLGTAVRDLFVRKSKPATSPVEAHPDKRTAHFREKMQKESRATPGELADIRQLGLHQALPDVSPAVLFDYYRKVWAFRAVVDKITTEATREGDEWADGDEPDAEAVDAPANVQAFIDSCNPLYTWKDLNKRIVRDLEVFDNAFVEVRAPDGKTPTELWALDARFTQARLDRRGRLGSEELFCPKCYDTRAHDEDGDPKDEFWMIGVLKEGSPCPNKCGGTLAKTAYVYIKPSKTKADGQKIIARWAKGEVLPWVKYSGASRIYGLSKAEAVANLAAILYYMETWQLNTYADSKTPDGFIFFPKMTRTQGEEMFASYLERKKKNPGKRIPIPLFGGDGSEAPVYVRMMESMADLEAVEVMNYCVEGIALCYGVSLKSLGKETAAKMGAEKSEGETVQVEVTNNTIEETQAQVAEGWNRFFKERFGAKAYWRLRSPRKDDLRRKAEIRTANLQAAKVADELGRTVKILESGLDLEISEEEDKERPEKPDPFGGAKPLDPKDPKLQPDGGSEALEKSLDSRNLPPGEAPVGLVLLEDEFSEKARDAYLQEFGAAVRSIPEGATKAEIEVILNRAAQRLTLRLEGMAARYAGDVASLTFRDEGDAFTQVDRFAIEALARRPDAFFSAIRTFPADAVSKMRDILTASFATQLDLRETVKRMEEAIGGEVYKLERIARSETTRIANVSRQMAWRSRPEFDPNERIYEWIIAQDHRVCPACIELALGNPYTLEEFNEALKTVSAKHFGQSFGEGITHPNDRCVIVRNPALLLEGES